jgi:hypothetical protein
LHREEFEKWKNEDPKVAAKRLQEKLDAEKARLEKVRLWKMRGPDL